MSREAYHKYRKSATLAYHETDDSITDRLQWACWQASWQECEAEQSKRIAELVEALNYIHSYMNEFTPDVNSLMFDVVNHTITYTESVLEKVKGE